MCWRQLSKLQKTVLIVLFYFLVYDFISFTISPETSFTFVRDDLRIGDKYALIFLVTSRNRTTVFSDADGADVFESRRCGKCFVTNNRGFLPMSEYDAILIHGDRRLLSEMPAFSDPAKRYLIETPKRCVRRKLRNCLREPIITSFSSKESFVLCSLCEHLHKKRLQPDQI